MINSMQNIFNKIRILLRGRYRPDLLARNVKCDKTTTIHHFKNVIFGRYIYIGPRCTLNAQGNITIGDGTIIGPEVVILSSSHSYKESRLLPYDKYDENRAVVIKQGVWIGQRAMICPGVTIGAGAIIAMGAVVVSDIEPGHVVGGNPAKVIATREKELISKLIEDDAYFHKTYWSGSRPRMIK